MCIIDSVKTFKLKEARGLTSAVNRNERFTLAGLFPFAKLTLNVLEKVP